MFAINLSFEIDESYSQMQTRQLDRFDVEICTSFAIIPKHPQATSRRTKESEGGRNRAVAYAQLSSQERGGPDPTRGE